MDPKGYLTVLLKMLAHGLAAARSLLLETALNTLDRTTVTL
jgi:hypothetical protein